MIGLITPTSAKTLCLLFPQLKEGGTYIIEDIHFSTFIEQQTETLPTFLFLELLKKGKTRHSNVKHLFFRPDR